MLASIQVLLKRMQPVVTIGIGEGGELLTGGGELLARYGELLAHSGELMARCGELLAQVLRECKRRH